MRTLRIGTILLLAGLFLTGAAAATHDETEQARRLVDETLNQVPVPETGPLGGKSGGSADDASGSSGSGSGFAASVVAAVTYVGQAAGAAGEGILNLGLALVSGMFTVFGEGGKTASSAVASVAANPASSGAIATVVALALGGSIGLLSLAQRYGSLGAIPLFSRIAKSDLLENKVRAEIFDLIKQNPGVNVSEISRRLDIAWGTATHHLQKLRAERLIAIRNVANQKCYFQNGGSYTPAEMDVMSATKNPTAKRIAQLLVERGPTCHQDIAEGLQISPALVSFHMRKLLDASVVQKERQGRRTIFSAATAVLEPAPRAAAH